MKFSKNAALAILNAGLETGAEYAEIYFQNVVGTSYSRRYHKVHGVSGYKSEGVGIRLMKGKQQVYGYTSDLSRKSLLKLAESLSLGFEGERVLELHDLKVKKLKRLSEIQVPYDAMTTDEKLSFLEEGEKAAFALSDKVQDVTSSLGEETEHVEIYNSEGDICIDDRIRTRVGVFVVCKDGDSFSEYGDLDEQSKGLEIFQGKDFPSVCRNTAKTALEMLSAPEGPSGEMPIVLGNGFGGVLFHEACGHPLEGSAIFNNTSVFSGKLGERIASPLVNAYDDGTIPNGWGSESVDDEGIQPTKNQLIKDGVLVNYMLDRYTAKRIDKKMKPTGSCRRESYRYLPTTRMTNTYIAAGESDPKDIIASVKDGIYCKAFVGGQVDPSTDQFIFTSDVAYLIKDGKIDHMIKPVTLIGYGYEILKKITMVGNDLKRAPGVCGAASGSIYVEVGQPTLLISKMLVGGNGGNE